MTCYNSLETETAHNYNFKVNRAVPDWHCLEEESARCNNWESQSARQIHKFRKLPQYRALRTKATRHISVNDDQKQQNKQNNYTFISDHHLLQFTFWKLTNWHLGDIHDDSFYLESLSLASKRFYYYWELWSSQMLKNDILCCSVSNFFLLCALVEYKFPGSIRRS